MLYESARVRLETVDGVGTLWLDTPEPGGNVVSRQLLHELGHAFRVAANHPCLDVLVIRSAKPGSFLAGPGAAEYASLTDEAARRGFAAAGWRVLDQLRQLGERMHTVAYIDGECRNAGLALALACGHRLAVAAPHAQIGCDFLDRGQLPALGLTVHLSRLIGVRNALDLMLNNRVIPARAATRLGLIDYAFGPRPAKTELWWYVAQLRDRTVEPSRRRTWLARLRESPRLFERRIMSPFDQIHGVQPRAVLAAVRRGWRGGAADGLAAETAAFVRDGLHLEASTLRRHCRDAENFAADQSAVPVPTRVGVAHLDEPGAMIAGLALRGGCSLSLRDSEGRRRLEPVVAQAVADGWLNVIEAEQRLKNVVLTAGRFHRVEVIFLTGTTDAQWRELAELDDSHDAHVILATTAGRPAAEALRFPQRVVGLSFCGETAVELVPAPQTDDETLAKMFHWLRRCGKWPLLPSTAEAAAVFAA